MASVSYQQLIDLAIGSPEPGHVNFYALHCVLVAFAEKLNIFNAPVDSERFGNLTALLKHGKSKSTPNFRKMSSTRSLKSRQTGGEDNPDDNPEGEEANEEAVPVEATASIVAPPADEVPAEEGEAAELPPAAEGEPEAAAEAAGDEGAEDAVEEPPPAGEGEDEDGGEDGEGELKPTAQSQRELADAEDLVESVQHLEERMSQIETVTQEGPQFTEGYARGLAVMKDQLDIAMEQLLKLTAWTVDKQTEPKQLEQLRGLAEKLRVVQRHNTFIENTSFVLGQRDSKGAMIEFDDEGDEEEAGMAVRSSERDLDVVPTEEPEDQYKLGLHLCYTPEKMLDQLMQMKSEFCMLTNKVNEISATILEQDCQRTTTMLQELQDSMRELNFASIMQKEMHERTESRLLKGLETIDEMVKGYTELSREKVDRTEIEVLLADKVDYRQLQRKVSHEQMQELRCQFEKEICEVDRIIKRNEKNLMQAMANLQSTIGLDTFSQLLDRFKEDATADLRKVDDKLQKYIDATNDECAAAGARVKVLQDLACLSCDTTCVMRTVEKAAVGKMPDAHATNVMSPLITYELGNIRKSGIMGYHRKDEFPHAPHAWMNKQAGLKVCMPRHAGGPHTTYTAKEKIEKMKKP